MEALMTYGLPGPKGDTGPQGIQGERGPKGDSATISMASKISVIMPNASKSYLRTQIIAVILPITVADSAGQINLVAHSISIPNNDNWQSYSTFSPSGINIVNGTCTIFVGNGGFSYVCGIVFLK